MKRTRSICRIHALPRLLLPWFLLVAAFGPAAAQDDPLDAVAEQAAVLDAAPELTTPGRLDLDAETLAAGGFIWIRVERDGIYRLSLSTPGSLVLASFPNADGAYDGQTKPARHGTAQSLNEPPVLGPLLLSRDFPYLLSAGSGDGGATLVLEQVNSVPERAPLPAEDTEIGAGDTLFAPLEALDLTLPGDPEPRRIQLLAEARATLDTRLAGEPVPTSGRYPWVSETPARLRFKASAGEASPAPLVLIRVVPDASDLDEAEPNEDHANAVSPGTPFRGHLLTGDEDRLAFTLEENRSLSLDLEWARPEARLAARLLDDRDDGETLLWERRPASGGLAGEPLDLAAGDYRLVLERVDRGAAPAPYTLRLDDGAAPRPNREAEPNDTPAAAQPLGEALRVSGTATADDVDRYRFTVPDDKAQHLWRVFTVDAERIQLSGEDGAVADVRASGRRSMADALALVPGPYVVTVRAEGDYLLRVMDLGPRPSDYEGEPNDRRNDGQRLAFGEGVRGGFHDRDDIDVYLFRVDAPSPVEIELKPAADGTMDARLYHEDEAIGGRILFSPGDPTYRFRSVLPPGEWSVQVRARADAIQEGYEVTVRRLPALAGSEPDDTPLQAAKLPRDGDFSGSVGGFDGADQVFVPLPEGEGMAAMVCTSPPDARSGRWRLHHWSDDSRVADIAYGLALFAYGPELGGAVRFGLAGNERAIPYACALRFPPTAPPPPLTAAVEEPGAPRTLAPGETLRATIAAEGAEPVLDLALEPNVPAFIACRDASGAILPPDTRVWELADVRTPSRELLGDLQPLVAGEAPQLRLRRTYAQRHGDGELPMDVDCTLYGVDDLARPSDRGPPAEFVVFERSAEEDATAAPGPPPPGLEALLTREAPARQPEGDLPVEIAIGELPDLAAFNDAGQRFPVTVSLTSGDDTTLPVTVRLSVSGERWRVEPPLVDLELAPGEVREVEAEVTAPPWLAPALQPNLVVRADGAGNAFAATMAALPIDAAAVPLEPFTFWHAPEALRGGLNVLHHGLGARLLQWGDEAADENIQAREAALHDGLAPHVGAVNLPQDVTFALAARAELAGVMIQLRSTDSPRRWPAEMEVHAPAQDGGWNRIGARRLETVHAPQYLVFDRPVTAERLRFTFPRCLGRCDQVWIQELQVIATPGTHPEGLPPINAADPDLGGHVLWSTDPFGGAWNREFLVGDPGRSNGGWPRPRKGRPLQVTVAFHQNRAARIQSVTWIGDPDDTARIPEAVLEASVHGPKGPWTTLGRLPAPPLDELRSSLTLETPAWARYLRFTFDIPEEQTHYGPDAVEVLETPGTSVLGLWEDDHPRAAWEAITAQEPEAAAPAAGGARRETAVPLPLETPVVSSVVIERNEDWWRITVPEGPARLLRLAFERLRPVVVPELTGPDGQPVPLEETGDGSVREAVVQAGTYHLRVFEPPRSVVIAWDTSGSVGHYIPRTLAAVRTWGRSLQPGRDALQLLPFGPEGLLLEDWAETPEALEPALRKLPESDSSASEQAMQLAAEALADRRGARGIVVMTDAETSINHDLWPALLEAMPRVVSLSVDSDGRQNAAAMMDWAALNRGRFQRVVSPLGLADGMDMANALFRAPKPYALTATLEELVEPEGEARLSVVPAPGAGSSASGAVELILDASGSMLQRMEGRRRIDIAHEALAGLVRDTLPEGTPFAFRAFGLEEDACRSELLVPLGPLDREAAAAAIEGVPAINLAKTAIADSLLAAGQDLSDARPPRVVVLVTDGEETCDGNPETAIATLRETGFDARVNIVGFAIDDSELAETFAAWADAGGGAYFDAGSAEALQQSISDALRPGFDLTRTYLDGRTESVGRVLLGDTLTVPAGRLTLTPGSGASGSALTLQVAPDGAVSVEYAPGEGLRRPQDQGR